MSIEKVLKIFVISSFESAIVLLIGLFVSPQTYVQLNSSDQLFSVIFDLMLLFTFLFTLAQSLGYGLFILIYNNRQASKK